MNRILGYLGVAFGIWLVSMTATLGQQQYQYTQYMLNNQLVNPAAVGVSDNQEIRLGGRYQNIGFPGAPGNIFANYNTAIMKREQEYSDVKQLPYFGAGGSIQYETTSPINKLSFYGNFAVHLPLSVKYTLSAGMSVGMQNQATSLSQSDGYSGTNGGSSDAALNNKSTYLPDGSVGLWLHSKELYAGISSQQLFNNKSALTNVELVRDYLFTAGYKIKVNADWDIIPTTLIKFIPLLPAAVEVSTRAVYKDFFWFGASYRYQDAIPIMFGLKLKEGYLIGLSYDFTTSLLNKYSYGTAELLVGYNLPGHKIAKAPAQFY